MTACAVVRIATSEIVREWSNFPPALDLPNGQRVVSPVNATHFGIEHGGYRFVEHVRTNWDQPSADHVLVGAIAYDLQALTITATKTWRLLTAQEIADRDAARKTSDIDAFIDEPIATLLFWMAKDPPPANPTQVQFRAWIESKWP